MTTISISPTKENRDRYRRLLRCEWTEESVGEVLALLWAVIAPQREKLPEGLRAILAPRSRAAGRYQPDPQVREKIEGFVRYFSDTRLPPVPSSLSAGKSNPLLETAERVWTYLVLSALLAVRGDIGFLADCQSLLFLIALDHLLPDLRKHEPEHNLLINALFMHTFLEWTRSPGHFFFLHGALADYMGDLGSQSEFLSHSLRFTPMDDHSFLSKLQAYCYSLKDCGKEDEAVDYLFRVYREAPSECLVELKEMIGHFGKPA